MEGSPEVNICSQSSVDDENHGNVLIIEPLIRRLLKVNHVTKVNHLVTTKDMFKIVTDSHKLNELEIAEAAVKQYLIDIEKNGGDIHFFKKQSFHSAHKRENSKGILTPQGAFDLDPANFMKTHMNHNEFEYLGLETRKGLGSKNKHLVDTLYHKVMVKSSILKKLVEESTLIDPLYIPSKGKILSYTSFFATICKSHNTQKIDSEIQKEMKRIAKDNTLAQIVAREKVALEDAEFLIEQDRVVLNNKRDALEKVVANMESVSDIDNYNISKAILERQRRDIDILSLKKKNEISQYYTSIKIYREKVNLNRAAQLEVINMKRREKRAVAKSKRMKIDNNLWGGLEIDQEEILPEGSNDEGEVEEEIEENVVVNSDIV